MTQTGSVLGTAYYVSPEQAQGKPLTPTTDIYSLGIVLYEATTGHVPFDAPDAVAVALKQVNEQPVPPHKLNPDIDPALEAIILRAMQKNPSERYSTADQMRTALNNYLSGRPINAGVPEPAAPTRVIGAVGREAAGDRAGRGAAAGAVVAGGVGAARAAKAAGEPGAVGAAARRVAPKTPATSTRVMPSVNAGLQPLAPVATPRTLRDKQVARAERNKIIAIIMGIFAVAVVVVAIILISQNLTEVVDETPTQVMVPNVVGYKEEDARRMILDAKLNVGRVDQAYSEKYPEGIVLSQDPTNGLKLDEHSAVNLVVSLGKEPIPKVKVPDITNQLAANAENMLRALGLDYSNGGSVYDDKVTIGRVISQDIAAGTEVERGTRVTYVTSGGVKPPEDVKIPDLTGKTREDATKLLTDLGLIINWDNRLDEYSMAWPAGIVVVQNLPADTSQPKGSLISLGVSKGPDPAYAIVPNLLGKTYSAALAELNLLGITLAPVTPLPPGTEVVKTQSLPTGSIVPKTGTVMVLTFGAP
jgi:serine/threonine-protein kinase